VDNKNLKTSSKGTNYQTAKLIRQGATVNQALAIAQKGEQLDMIAKKAKRRQRLGM
jgi:hypothetical protein